MAKKTAEKKTQTLKKKAVKRGAPSKVCPKCSKTLHAAKVACDCGYKFPAKKKLKKKPGASTAASDGQAAPAGAVPAQDKQTPVKPLPIMPEFR